MIKKKIQKKKTTYYALIILNLFLGSSTCYAFNVQSLRESCKALVRQITSYFCKEPQNTRVLKKSAENTAEPLRMSIGPQIRQVSQIINENSGNGKNNAKEEDYGNVSTELVYFRPKNREIIRIPKNYAEYLSGQGYGDILQEIDLRVK